MDNFEDIMTFGILFYLHLILFVMQVFGQVMFFRWILFGRDPTHLAGLTSRSAPELVHPNTQSARDKYDKYDHQMALGCSNCCCPREREYQLLRAA